MAATRPRKRSFDDMEEDLKLLRDCRLQMEQCKERERKILQRLRSDAKVCADVMDAVNKEVQEPLPQPPPQQPPQQQQQQPPQQQQLIPLQQQPQHLPAWKMDNLDLFADGTDTLPTTPVTPSSLGDLNLGAHSSSRGKGQPVLEQRLGQRGRKLRGGCDAEQTPEQL